MSHYDGLLPAQKSAIKKQVRLSLQEYTELIASINFLKKQNKDLNSYCITLLNKINKLQRKIILLEKK